MFKKVLVANRGEIAVRVLRACRDTGITGVAVYSEADTTALHARYADEAYCIGAAPVIDSYLNGPRIIEAALKCGAEAIHPGYGFLSEQSDFARACIDAGIAFIGPSPEALDLLGDKVAACRLAEAAGVPIVPGSAGRVEADQAREVAERVGYPLLIKAAAGGGGKGIRLVESADDLEPSLRVAAAEAEANFGDGGLYIERYLDPVRHIEVQVLADKHGNVVHLGERECSIQRRSQKLVEESPSVAVDPALRLRLGAAAVAIARQAGYENAGTVEFLLDRTGAFYFIEANARLQVEHPVTELVTGLDLVREQLRIAAGEPLAFRQADVTLRGSAIECRITAEDAEAGFMPSLGRVELVSEPSGPGVRVDSSLFPGMEVSPYYDSLLSKLIVWGSDRDEALRRLRRALSEYQVLGVKTTLPFHRELMQDQAFLAGDIHTHFLDGRDVLPQIDPKDDTALVVAALLAHQRRREGDTGLAQASARGGWREQARRTATERNGGGRWRSTF
ncbi:MAG TPA: acetyl-CoA carboxylase biotin carboxylase subunit [Dehalococcoidia bacterium]|nr:acetyl-CoA carboxylase biotin carboxylase subunit [Dehalococcoidia bacterium]